jgi:two-component system CheB/CheR fusion protein
MAFIFIQHLAPSHESLLSSLLSRATPMPVIEVTDGMRVEPDHAYVIPPNKSMAILHGTLHLMPRGATRGQHLPIDAFLRSLAEDQRDNAIAVILSGTGADGSLGIKAIKAEGGIVFAQDKGTAKYDSMPQSAVTTGYVDFTMPPKMIARELVRLGHHPLPAPSKREMIPEAGPEKDMELNKIFIMLRTATGVDFTYYKRPTIRRRIMRRMLLHRMEKAGDYIQYLQHNPQEVEALYGDILINVTSFFREPKTYDALKLAVFPKIARKTSANTSLRIWVPGCSTGEEAYSIAISLLESMAENKLAHPIQIFASDIDGPAIDKARRGVYPESIIADVSPERLRRFFVKTESGFQVSKAIRESCVFARHNLVKDPPFSKLDLISCRNLLIYFGAELQRKALLTMHYALNPDGFLMLGASESVGEYSNLFSLEDKRNKIYSKKSLATRQPSAAPPERYPAGKVLAGKERGDPVSKEIKLLEEVDAILAARYSPPGVIVNETMEILQFRGDTSLYLRPLPGKATLNLMKMVHGDLALEIRTAIHNAKKNNVSVRKEGLKIRHNDKYRYLNIEILSVGSSSAKERFFLVLFEKALQLDQQTGEEKKRPRPRTETPRDEELVRLKHEYATTREQMKSLVAEHEASNEELQALNEEVQSSNEELQSINEELETSKEELQSTNEELTTVNEELQNRNIELSQTASDLMNILGGVEIPIILLGKELQIRRFNIPAGKLLKLLQTDIGRPLSDIRTNLAVPDLDNVILDVINTLTPKDQDIQDLEGRWYSIRIRPYRTLDHKIEGALISMVDIDERKKAKDALDKAYQKLEGSLAEKAILMDEIYHRVKNNMQTMVSLLRLQSRYVDDKKSRELLAESQDRIRAMALVHEKLYQTKDFTYINYREYIKDLLDGLWKTYGADTSHIALSLDIDDISFGIEPAIHLGLIINELVNNAVKHAFPDGRAGKIRIMLKKTGGSGAEAECELIVADNGVGIPEGVDIRGTTTLGLHLVTMLGEDQLHGHIEVNRTKGTEIRVRFKEGEVCKKEG